MSTAGTTLTTDGTRVTITVNGTPVAEIGPLRATRPQFFSTADVVALVARHQADPGPTRDLEMLAGDVSLAERGHRAKIDDLWIAAMAQANGIDVDGWVGSSRSGQ